MRKDEEERQKMRRKRRKIENKVGNRLSHMCRVRICPDSNVSLLYSPWKQSRRENMMRSLQASAEGAREVDQALKWSEKESREQHRTV